MSLQVFPSRSPQKNNLKRNPKGKKSATKQEEQIDWMTVDILDRFIGLSTAQQQTTLDKAEARLKGAKQLVLRPLKVEA